jgi:hypothetical protein
MSVLLAAATIVCSLSFSAFAESVQKSDEKHLTADKIEVLPDGGKLYTYIIDGVRNVFPVPPTGFKPIEATDDELAQYGFPARPDDKTGLDAWNAQMAYYKYTPEPDISVTDRTNGTVKLADVKSDGAGTLNTTNWADYYASGNFVQVQGNFTQPTVQSGCLSNTYESTWVGLGGVNTGKLVQTGTAMNTRNGANSYYAWYEYLSPAHPNPEIKFNSITVSGGDSIHAYCSFQSSNNRFNAYVANNTNGTSQTVLVDISASEYFDSSTAEWINEHPSVSGTDNGLTKYGSNGWTTAQAYTNTGTWYNITSLTYDRIDMYNGSTVRSRPSGLSGGSFTSNWYAY